ncbi:MAG: MOP flippase family protein [Dyadobacter sp.]|uniref:MOP flippase family protein n=1 Tax=Dyadobacter sp. TaxID=1914288 RepID=UPI001B124166|nr:MOP flippase family protein [Dyadobacter sp.]MBO9616865.1 MOP flippase family protein [Dyadobacter sp.]
MSLKQKAFGAAKWTSFSAMATSVMQLLQIVILSRFIDKADFGLMAIALFVIGLSQMFMDMGISNAIIHNQKVTSKQINTLFWLNIFAGITIYVTLYICTPFIADFYHSPELVSIIRWTSATYLIVPFGQQFETLLVKELNFKSLSIRDVIGKTGGLLASVLLAFWHYGIYALVYANLFQALVSTALLVVYGLKIFRPKLEFDWYSLKNEGFFSFGLFQMGEKTVNYFNSQFDTLLIGKLLGMEALGIYNIAKTLAFKPYQIINPIVTKVAFPVLAKMQDDIDKLRRAYIQILRLLTYANAPVYAAMIILAKPLIILFFGEAWTESIPFLRILAITALCNSIGNPVGALLMARGRADWGFYWNLGMLLFMPLCIWIGSFWGLEGIAWGLTLFKIAVMLPAWGLFVYPLCKAKFLEYFGSVGKPILLATASAVVAYLVSPSMNNNYLDLGIGLFILGAVYVGLGMLATNNQERASLMHFFANKGQVGQQS